MPSGQSYVRTVDAERPEAPPAGVQGVWGLERHFPIVSFVYIAAILLHLLHLRWEMVQVLN